MDSSDLIQASNSPDHEEAFGLRLWRAFFVHLSEIEHKFISALTVALLLLPALLFPVKNYRHYLKSGDTWIHGDWLISFEAGPLRRGLSGEFVFTLSDFSGLGPLVVVQIIQAFAVWAMIGAIILVLLRLKFPVALCALCLTPTFAMFWQNIDGAHAKDVFGFLAFVPLMLAALNITPLRIALGVSCLIFAVAAGFYEPAIFYAPALLIAAYFVAHPSNTRLYLWYGLAIFLIAAFWAGFAVMFSSVENSAMLCDPVIARGVADHICIKFVWSGAPVEHALSYVEERLGRRNWAQFSTAVALSILPILILFGHRAFKMPMIILIGQTLIFLPLYVVATDYGRWLNLQVTSVMLVILIAASAGAMPYLREPISRAAIYPLLILALLWGVSPILGALTPGLLGPVTGAIFEFGG